MFAVMKIPDSEAHEPGCMHADSGVECSDPNLTYLDVFCDCHHYTEPKILANGTDIAWPAGWTQDDADAWRQAHDLKPAIIA